MTIEEMIVAVEEAGYMQRCLSTKEIKSIQAALRAGQAMRKELIQEKNVCWSPAAQAWDAAVGEKE